MQRQAALESCRQLFFSLQLTWQMQVLDCTGILISRESGGNKSPKGSTTVEVLVVGNPVAGRGKAESRILRFVQILERKGHSIETVFTQKPGDAFRTAASSGRYVERIIVAGGDGTLNEVLNGLDDPSQVPILTLPSGTANMLAADLNLPRKLEVLADLVDAGNIRKIDMGLVGDRRFLLVVSAGFDAAVTKVLAERRGRRLGYVGYVMPILRAVRSHRPVKLTVLVDDHAPIFGTNVLVLKVRRYGGYFVFEEDARLDSGYFHVCVLPDGTVPAILRYGLAGFFGMTSRLKGITRITGRKITIEADEPVAVELDGDYLGTTPINVEIIPALVPVIVPNVLFGFAF